MQKIFISSIKAIGINLHIGEIVIVNLTYDGKLYDTAILSEYYYVMTYQRLKRPGNSDKNDENKLNFFDYSVPFIKSNGQSISGNINYINISKKYSQLLSTIII